MSVHTDNTPNPGNPHENSMHKLCAPDCEKKWKRHKEFYLRRRDKDEERGYIKRRVSSFCVRRHKTVGEEVQRRRP